jgi:RNA polymerase sigma-70 factor (ECF subfamily)
MRLYKNKIFNYLRILVNNEELAEELTQDTFVKVYFKAHTLKTDNLKSWIYAIATNLARSEFRKRKVKHLFSISDISESLISYNPSYDSEILMNQLLACLPEKYKIPLVMKEIDNFSFQEISDIMSKPVGTVKTLVFRGKNQLRDQVKKQDNPVVKSNPGGVSNE